MMAQVNQIFFLMMAGWIFKLRKLNVTQVALEYIYIVYVHIVSK